MTQATAFSSATVASLRRQLARMSRRVADLRRRLAAEAAPDALTALPTRHEFERLLMSEWHRAARLGLALCILAIDVDGLPHIKERMGPAAGDQVLRAIGEFLRSHSRPYDVVARLADDSFVLMTVRRPSDSGSPADIARRLGASIPPVQVDREAVQVTLSVGVAAALPTPETPTEPIELYRTAREALAQAKQAGGNRVHLADPPPPAP